MPPASSANDPQLEYSEWSVAGPPRGETQIYIYISLSLYMYIYGYIHVYIERHVAVNFAGLAFQAYPTVF